MFFYICDVNKLIMVNDLKFRTLDLPDKKASTSRADSDQTASSEAV